MKKTVDNIDNFGALVNEVSHLREDVDTHQTLIDDLKKAKHAQNNQLHGLQNMFAILQDSVQCLSTDTKKLSLDTQDLKKTFEIGTTYLKVLVKLAKVLSWISGTGLVILSILQILGML